MKENLFSSFLPRVSPSIHLLGQIFVLGGSPYISRRRQVKRRKMQLKGVARRYDTWRGTLRPTAAAVTRHSIGEGQREGRRVRVAVERRQASRHSAPLHSAPLRSAFAHEALTERNMRVACSIHALFNASTLLLARVNPVISHSWFVPCLSSVAGT